MERVGLRRSRQLRAVTLGRTIDSPMRRTLFALVLSTAATVVVLAVGAAVALPALQARSSPAARPLAAVTPGHSSQRGAGAVSVSRPVGWNLPVRRVLAGDGIGDAAFGQIRAAVVLELVLLLRRAPSRPYYALSGLSPCGIDHAAKWPGLVVFFHHGHFVGYTYGLSRKVGRQPVLETTKGLRVGDTLSVGERLYESAFTISASQGGSWRATTRHGRIDGFASRLTNPKGKVVTIEAGDVGCPAMAP